MRFQPASRNQLANVGNPYQGDNKRVLFLCSAGLLRSATAAHLFSAEPYDWNTRTAGVSLDFALNPVNEALLVWADAIFVMTEDHLQDLKSLIAPLAKLNPEYPANLLRKVKVLNIEDDFGYRDETLCDLLEERMNPFLDFVANS